MPVSIKEEIIMWLRVLFILILTSIGTAQQLPDSFELTPAGKFNQTTEYDRISDNGIYSCNFTVGAVGDEYRELTDLTFYENGNLRYALKKVPGSDLYISNSGITAFIDHTFHFRNRITINFYSPDGSLLNSLQFEGAYLFDFSDDGNIMGVGTPGKLSLYSESNNKISEYPGCIEFAVSGSDIVLADQENISVYSQKELEFRIPVNSFVRKIKIVDEDTYCYITKDQFIMRSLKNNEELYSKVLPYGYSYSDLLVCKGKIFTGMNKREGGSLAGYLAAFENNQLTAPVEVSSKIFSPVSITDDVKDSVYEPISWPFAPFDSVRTAWNHYEQNMGYGDPYFSYLHQGLDLIVPVNEPVYAVQQGIVKLVLTTGGDIYWRVAVSPVQEPGRSDGWLYAHLVETSIPVFTGDTVDIHEPLGNIIYWAIDWGHIHFVQINDSGSVWLYNDNEWGINFNPYLALQPLTDTTAPVIENSSSTAKFEFCQNESSVYLDANNLSGEVDIIVKVVDYIGNSEWQQPAFKSYYWIKRLSDDSIVVSRKLGHILNHPYPMYSGEYYEPYAKVLYKLDNTHPASSWMDTERNYYHIITNNNGDELLDTTERYLALDTRLFYDDIYRIYVEVYDPAGNSALDSMDVEFNNGISSADDEIIPTNSELFQNFPNPFNPSTTISFRLQHAGKMKLELFDFLGQKIAVLLDGYQDSGYHKVKLDSDLYNLSCGVYFYKLNAENFSSVKKLILIK